MKVGFIASTILNDKKAEEFTTKALNECGFVVDTLFPIGTNQAYIKAAKDWAAFEGVNINTILEGEDLAFNGALNPQRKQKILAAKTNLALVAIWDGGSAEIKNLITLCKTNSIPVYVTNGKYVIGV